MKQTRQFIAIDLKSFYASVEAVERGLDPLDVNLVVADESRTDKTICLAVSPALKAFGIPGRARLFEVRQKVAEVNALRKAAAPSGVLSGTSSGAAELAANPSLALAPVIATPRMKYYMEYSRRIVEIYLKYVSAEDLLVYSVDEVFIDATHYLSHYKMTARELGLIRDPGVLTAAADNAIRANPEAARQYLNGKEAALQALKGACMKATRGRAEPALLDKLLRERLAGRN